MQASIYNGDMLYLLGILILGPIAYAAISLAPRFPTSNKDLEQINKLSELQDGEEFIEFGCGDGKVCTYIAQHNPQAKVVGIELAYPFYMIACIRKFLSNCDNLKIVYGNAFKYNISSGKVIYIFGLPKTVNGLFVDKINKELSPKSKVISYIFEIENKNFDQKKHSTHRGGSIYVYEKVI